MISIILVTIATIIITILAKKTAKKRGDGLADYEKLAIKFSSIALLILIDLISWGIYSGINVETTRGTEVISSVDLVALQDNPTTSGEFFLGCGSLNSKTCYAYYYETELGYKYATIDAESKKNPVYIQYIPSAETPHIDQYSIVQRSTLTADGSNSWLFSIIAWLNFGQSGPGDIVFEDTTSATIYSSNDASHYDNFRCVIYIPEGSIKTDYTIDME